MHISIPFQFTQDQSEDLSFFTEAFSIWGLELVKAERVIVKYLSIANHITASGEIVSTPVNLALVLSDDIEDHIKNLAADGLTVEAGRGSDMSPIDANWSPPKSKIIAGEPHIVAVREAPTAVWPAASARSLIEGMDRSLITSISAQSTTIIPSEMIEQLRSSRLYVIPYIDSLKSQPIVAAGRLTFDIVFQSADGTFLFGGR